MVVCKPHVDGTKDSRTMVTHMLRLVAALQQRHRVAALAMYSFALLLLTPAVVAWSACCPGVATATESCSGGVPAQQKIALL